MGLTHNAYPSVYLRVTNHIPERDMANVLAGFPAVKLIHSQSEFERCMLLGLAMQFDQGRWVFTLPGSGASVCVDYAQLFRARRLNANTLRAELLVKAVFGRRRATEKLSVVDATAGLGRDAFILAAAGCEVTAVERNPILIAVLQQVLCSASESENTAVAAAAKRVRCTVSDSVQFFRQLSEKEPDVIYLDPMYRSTAADAGVSSPDARHNGLKSTAAVKKEAQLLQYLNDLYLAGSVQTDSGIAVTSDLALIQAARDTAGKKVVVKRAAKAPFLAGMEPGSSVTGKAVRFDVYPCA